MDTTKTSPRQEALLEMQALVEGPRPLSSCIYVYGAANSGKSHSVLEVLRKLSISDPKNLDQPLCLVYVNCIDAASSCRLFYETILLHLQEDLSRIVGESQQEVNYTELSCAKGDEFIYQLRERLHQAAVKCGHSLKCVIVVDQLERLRGMCSISNGPFSSFVSLLTRLGEFIQDPPSNCIKNSKVNKIYLTTVFISQLPLAKFYEDTFYTFIHTIHLPVHSEQDLMGILYNVLSVPIDDQQNSKSTSNTLISFVIKTVTTQSLALTEIIHLAKTVWEPFRKEVEEKKDQYSIWKRFQPVLTKYMAQLYSRQTVRADVVDIENTNMDFLPHYAHFLLTAAFIASYNHPSSDARFFTKNTGRVTSYGKTMLKKKEKTSNICMGPKPFTADRMFAIFYVLLNESKNDEGQVRDVMSHPFLLDSLVRTLAEKKLLLRYGGGSVSQKDNSLLSDRPKYRCMISLTDIMIVAKKIGYDIMHYLTDYA